MEVPHGTSVHDDFVHVTIPSVDSIILSQNAFPSLETRYLWQLPYQLPYRILTPLCGWKWLRSGWWFRLYISFSLNMQTYIRCFVLFRSYHDGARDLPQINMYQLYPRKPFQRTDNHSLWLLRLRRISTPQRRKNLVHVLLLSTETGSCFVQIRDYTIRTINIKLSSRPRWLRVNQAQSLHSAAMIMKA